jgi:hypothetical protein
VPNHKQEQTPALAKKILFHIGLPKSGTTFVQTMMWHNRKAMRRQGICYPGKRRMDHYHASEVVRELGIPNPTNAWKNLLTELNEWPKTGLLSHEFFSMATAAQAQRAVSELGTSQVEILVTARDYVRQFPAVWQEALKMKSQLSLDEFFAKAMAHKLRGAWSWNSQRLPNILAEWSQSVPANRITIVTLPPAGSDRSLLWQRWTQATGIDDTHFRAEVAASNESLGAPQAALLHFIKPLLKDPLTSKPELHRWVRQYFGHEVLVPQGGPRFGLRPDQASQLADLAAEDVQTLAECGYRVVGDLRDLLPVTNQPLMAHPDDVTEPEMLAVAGEALVSMIEEVRRLNKLLAEPPTSSWAATTRGALRRGGRSLKRRVQGKP